MKTREEIEAQIDRLAADDRLEKVATVIENAPLALIQTDIEGKLNALKWVLDEK